MNIREIEAMTREDIEREKLEGPISIKEHDIYFVDIQPYFGYSAIVFFKDRQIHYANDYELHHKSIPSTPLILSSNGTITEFFTVSASAPG